MHTKEALKHMAVLSAVLFAGCAGSVSLADSEASFQAGSQSSSQNQSDAGHVGTSQANRESTNQGGTGSMSDAGNESSTQAHEEAGRVPVLQPSTSNRPIGAGGPATNSSTGAANVPPAGSSGNAGARPTGPSSRSASATSTPHMKTTTYNWGRGHSRSRIASRSHHNSNRSYMVNTIHQAASTK